MGCSQRIINARPVRIDQRKVDVIPSVLFGIRGLVGCKPRGREGKLLTDLLILRKPGFCDTDTALLSAQLILATSAIEPKISARRNEEREEGDAHAPVQFRVLIFPNSLFTTLHLTPRLPL